MHNLLFKFKPLPTLGKTLQKVNNITVYSESDSTILFYLVTIVHQLVLAGVRENLFHVIIKLACRSSWTV
jgi:hypothetical protein